MIDFFLLPANTPFVVSLGVMFVFTVLEILSSSLGVGLSEMIDSLLPEFDADIDIDIDADGDLSGVDNSTGLLADLLSWFRIGEVPVIMLFIIFLTSFGLCGLIIQYLFTSVAGFVLPATIASVPAFLCTIPAVRILGGLLGKYMPKDETYVVSEESFIGMRVTITLGQATAEKTAQAKLKDKYGQAHYLLVQPDIQKDSFVTGDKGIVVSKRGSIYTIIHADNVAMSD